jgi:predicted nucleic acid-binding protein
VISRRVVNASPLIFLTRVGLLDVLNEPGVPVIVPDAVFAELGGVGPNDPAALAVRQIPWFRVVPTPPIPELVGAWGLDSGESAVMAVALQQPDSQAILDDLAARRCARALNVPLQGTLGLILVAKQLGMISAVRPILDTLRQTGMYVSNRLAQQVLDQAGE